MTKTSTHPHSPFRWRAFLGSVVRRMFANELPYLGGIFYSGSPLVSDRDVFAILTRRYRAPLVRALLRFLQAEQDMLVLGDGLGAPALTAARRLGQGARLCVTAASKEEEPALKANATLNAPGTHLTILPTYGGIRNLVDSPHGLVALLGNLNSLSREYALVLPQPFWAEELVSLLEQSSGLPSQVFVCSQDPAASRAATRPPGPEDLLGHFTLRDTLGSTWILERALP